MLVVLTPMQVPVAEQLIEEGRILTQALASKCPKQLALVKSWSLQKRALAKLAHGAARNCPDLMFRAMFEGWSATKIRMEINKKLTRTEERYGGGSPPGV